MPATRWLATALLLAAACGRGDRGEPARRADVKAVDAAPDAPPFAVTGPPTPEAAARAFVAAAARGDVDAVRDLAMTVEVNRALYDCSRRPDYEMDRLAQRSVDELVTSAEVFASLAAAGERFELGAWAVQARATHGANTRMTIACDTRRVLAVNQASLALTIVDAKGTPREAKVAFVIVELTGVARVNSATLVDDVSSR